MGFLWKGKRFEILFSILLCAFTAYALLDTFVIPRRYAAAETTAETSAEALREEIPVRQTVDESAQNAASAQDAEPAQNEDADPARNGVQNSAESGVRRQRKGRRAQAAESTEVSGIGGTPASQAAEPEAAESETAGERGDVQADGTEIRSWSDGNISVVIRQYRAYNTDVYAADVTLSSPEYLKTALAGNAYGRNIKEKTSAIAAENQAVLAVNGDFYGARNSGYVIRNGVLYRESGQGGEVLAVFADGSFQIVDDRQVSARELLEAGAVQTFSFGPALVKDGLVTVTEGQEVGKAMASNPRTAIGILDDLHYVFVAADGRTGQSEGLSLYELASFLEGLGVHTAYNLDGGGSSTMVFQGEIINHPTTSGSSVKERSVSDIVYVGP
ncbi:MAG: phosphodiester glycosidase family protein [Oscillibacter sp.]|nr:phosphodiester glycosidase family protein [Oscillibacter sp.]